MPSTSMLVKFRQSVTSNHLACHPDDELLQLTWSPRRLPVLADPRLDQLACLWHSLLS